MLDHGKLTSWVPELDINEDDFIVCELVYVIRECRV